MTKYSKLQISLHWGMAVLIAFQFILSDGINHAFKSILRGTEYSFDPLVMQHVIGGFLILALVLWRLRVRKTHGTPPLPSEESPMFKKLAQGVHWALYAFMVIIPISGAVAWFAMNKNAANAHELLKTGLIIALALHVGGALYHQFVLKTQPLKRMWF